MKIKKKDRKKNEILYNLYIKNKMCEKNKLKKIYFTRMNKLKEKKKQKKIKNDFID